MHRDHKKISGGPVILALVLSNIIVLERGLVAGPKWYSGLLITIPLLLIVFFFFRRKQL